MHTSDTLTQPPCRLRTHGDEASQWPTPKSFRAILLLILASAVFIHTGIVLAFSGNVPVGDDYHVLDSVLAMRSASDQNEFLRLLLALHNEHRIVLTRIIAYAMSHLPGGVDFRYMIIIGNLALPLSLLVISWFFRPEARLAATTVASLLLLLPLQFALMFFPMAAIQAYWGLLFFFLYLLFSLRNGTDYVAPVFFIAAALTSGGGLFLFLPITIALAIRRRWLPLAINIVLAMVVAKLYLTGMPRTEGGHLAFALENPGVVARLFFGIAGNIAQVLSYKFGWLTFYTTPAMGAFLLCLSGYIIFKVLTSRNKTSPHDIATVCCLVYSLMMIGIITLTRARLYHELDYIFNATLDGRYRIYCFLLCIFCLNHFVQRLHFSSSSIRRLVMATSLGLLVFYGASSRYGAEESRVRMFSKIDMLRNWRETGDASQLVTLGALPPQAGADILDRAIEAGVFIVPDR